ncbi:MAG: RNA-guided pseudouridylation complex pseudouridine synthase subunit Cbf5 [Candidatus Nanohaloarchaeota archaeon QJJ-7]|nr:RNA-guided pseudouridylation complex pseudouridine synthase subunit Cbf5 [Candidatus Nanohaloarchaeota archaeon QJJ-7]
MLPSEIDQDREWLVKEEADTDWDYGERPENRPLEEKLSNGIVLVDKPAGPQSNQVSVWVKELLERGKTGHSGTLDPHVTGLLPVGLDEGTKIMGPLSNAGKEYIGLMSLDEEIGEEKIEETSEEFVGTVEQVPPEKSAVKREERERDIYELEVLEVDGKNVLFRVECEKGFYVRTFCKQFGDALGTDGEMDELRRTKVGVFEERETVNLQDLADQYEFWKEGEDNSLEELVLPVEAGVRHLKKIIVKDSAVAALAHGADLGTGGISKLQKGIETDELLAVLTLKGELIATANAEFGSDEMLEEGGTAATLDRVYIGKDEYPREW